MNFLANPLLASTSSSDALASVMDPFGFGRAAMNYWRDSVERNILYWDVMRERGNQYLAHMEQTKPNVLGFETEVLMDGRTLPNPTNYELLRVLPPSNVQVDPQNVPSWWSIPARAMVLGSAVSSRTASLVLP